MIQWKVVVAVNSAFISPRWLVGCVFGELKEVWLRVSGQVLTCFFFLTPFSSVSSWFGPLTAHLRHAKNILHFDFCPGWATRKRPKSPYLGLYSCQPIARYQVTLNHRCPPQIATLHFLHLVFSKLASFRAISVWGSEGVSLRDEGGVLGAARCSRAGWPLSTRGQQRPSGKTTKKRLQALPNIPWGAKPPPTENH